MIKDTELELLEDFDFGNVSEKEFLNRYPVDLVKEKHYFIDLVNETIENKDAETLDLLTDVMASLTLYEDFDFQSLYRRLLNENWHKMHESLVDSLEKTKVNEDSFISVLKQTYDYHAEGIEDFMVPIWSKCLWNLYKIRSERGIELIKSYVNSKYDYLSNTAKKLVAKLENE